VYNLEDDYDFYGGMEFITLAEALPDEWGRLPRGVYRGEFTLTDTADTFLDFSSWGKGLVYVNGHPLGRIWNIGPQQTLYMPGCWLNKGKNEILVFDITGPEEAVTSGLSQPVLDRLNIADVAERENVAVIDLAEETPVATASFAPGNGWKEVLAGNPVQGRYICIECLSAVDGSDNAAIAELFVLDGKGDDIPRENWRTIYTDSEDAAGGNHTPDKIFDLQESTYWASAPEGVYPYRIVIDMGDNHSIGGLRYLPRMESGAPDAIRDMRLYVSGSPFRMKTE
ncbi:MAG: beta-galactosidase, partial [Muribaculaceae bacterium]|nr:beta-galactosidase [Muribaculaceae bacterium]